MDHCEQCAHYVTDEEFGDYCDVNLDEDEMEKFITQTMKSCHYFQPLPRWAARDRCRGGQSATAAAVGSPRF